ncbi:MAG: DUF2207 domain-containing protein [Propionibacterium sp.]|nr:DUF2207 domain-containing protein [Propionibacterium sp.]
MHRVLRLIGVLALILGTALLPPGPAHAADDEVRRLDAQFEVQPDGSMLVRYELHWRFAEKGRHGIDFRIATRENWEPDPSQDVVYRVDDIEVSSPSGAPATFTERTSGYGSEEEIVLRIGDPNIELDTRDASYVISYRLDGAMRTFDGIPELQWDVISDNYPEIEEFIVTVSGPDGVDRARCDSSPDTECTDEIRDGAAHFRAEDVTSATSVYVQFPPGSVDNAEPTLEQRRLSAPEQQEHESLVEVDPDGSARVRHEMQYLLPVDDESETLRLEVAERLPWDVDRDQVIEYSDVSVTDQDGQALAWTDAGVRGQHSNRKRQLEVEVPVDPTDPAVTVIFEYTTRGAVVVDGDLAVLRFSPVLASSYSVPRTVEFRMPGPVRTVRMLSIGRDPGVRESTDPQVSVDGSTARGAWEGSDGPVITNEVLSVEFAASSLTGAVPPLVDSLDKEHRRTTRLGWATGVGGGLGLAGLGVALGRLRLGRDRRYANVPPGVIDGNGPVRPVRRSDEVPVVFGAPEAPLHIAGLLRDREFEPIHMGAVLVDLAVKGAVTLRSHPLGVARAGEVEGLTHTEREIVRDATDHPNDMLSPARARLMRAAIERDQQNYLKDRHWFQPDRDGWRFLLTIAALAVPLLAGLWFIGRLGVDNEFMLWMLLVFGAGVGFVAARSRGSRPALQARGRAVLDEVEGFRTYLATAEAEQLNFEADRDIYRRYLPWAVLFDLTDRWTRVCQQVAESGRIDPPDTSFIAATSIGNLGSELKTFTSNMRSTSAPPSSSSSSSGGSGGGSSGFSSGGGGGGGGGGTSASSW